MEFVHGGTLRDLIWMKASENQCFTDLEASILMKSILKAVQYIHMKNTVHRDLKPCNFFSRKFS